MIGNLVKIAFISILAFFSAAQPLIYLILAITFLDFITGFLKSMKISGTWKCFKSRIARRSIVKTMCYLIAVLVGYAIELVIFGSAAGYLTKSIASSIILVEFSSLLENMAVITGQTLFLKIFDITKTIFNTNKDILTKIDPTLNQEDDDETKS